MYLEAYLRHLSSVCSLLSGLAVSIDPSSRAFCQYTCDRDRRDLIERARVGMAWRVLLSTTITSAWDYPPLISLYCLRLARSIDATNMVNVEPAEDASNQISQLHYGVLTSFMSQARRRYVRTKFLDEHLENVLLDYPGSTRVSVAVHGYTSSWFAEAHVIRRQDLASDLSYTQITSMLRVDRGTHDYDNNPTDTESLPGGLTSADLQRYNYGSLQVRVSATLTPYCTSGPNQHVLKLSPQDQAYLQEDLDKILQRLVLAVEDNATSDAGSDTPQTPLERALRLPEVIRAQQTRIESAAADVATRRNRIAELAQQINEVSYHL